MFNAFTEVRKISPIDALTSDACNHRREHDPAVFALDTGTTRHLTRLLRTNSSAYDAALMNALVQIRADEEARRRDTDRLGDQIVVTVGSTVTIEPRNAPSTPANKTAQRTITIAALSGARVRLDDDTLFDTHVLKYGSAVLVDNRRFTYHDRIQISVCGQGMFGLVFLEETLPFSFT
jgi:hypothetical protein